MYPEFPFCSDFDGESCWACVPGYLLNLILNKCVPYTKPETVTPNNIETVDIYHNCNTYSEEENKCV